MTKTRFKKELRRGLGSALIELQHNNCTQEFKDIVLWCCLHVTSYDAQCEGNRSEYLYQALDTFEDTAFFLKQIIERFEKENIYMWLFDQLCGLIYLFAENGNVDARNALYKKYEHLYHILAQTRRHIQLGRQRENFEELCIQIIKLDGFDAFKNIVSEVSTYYASVDEPDRIFMEWFYLKAKEFFGEERVDEYLDTQVKVSKGVDAMLKKEMRLRPPSTKREQPKPTLMEYIDACEETARAKSYKRKKGDFVVLKSKGLARFFAKCASKEDLIKLANAAIAEQNQALKTELLWVFRFVAFPLSIDYVIEWTKIEGEDLKGIAYQMLNLLSGKQSRSYAIKLLTEGIDMADAIDLLCHNYKPDDEKLLIKSLKRLPVTYNGLWHRAYMEVEDLCKKYDFPLKEKILKYLYHNTLCSYCRESIVKTMHEAGLLTKEILHECLYDSYEETRSFAKEMLSN